MSQIAETNINKCQMWELRRALWVHSLSFVNLRLKFLRMISEGTWDVGLRTNDRECFEWIWLAVLWKVLFFFFAIFVHLFISVAFATVRGRLSRHLSATDTFWRYLRLMTPFEHTSSVNLSLMRTHLSFFDDWVRLIEVELFFFMFISLYTMQRCRRASW